MRGLVQHEQLGVAGQRARDGQHLLLAAGEAPPPLPPALAQDGEVGEDAFARPARVAVDASLGQPEILADLEVGKDLPPLGDIPYPQVEDLVRGMSGDVAVLEAHRAAPRRRQSHDRAQRRRLARAVAPEEHGDLPRRDREGDVAQHVALAVEGLEGVDGEERHSAPPR